MGRCGGWLSFKRSFLFSTKSILLKIASGFRNNNKGSRDVLLSIYKDLESCQEYEDIQVMWAMIHSSSACPPKTCNHTRRNKRPSSYWRFCFRQT
ncbi:hypothetical protein KPL71_018200 [Citrus sinensis]|uniref:Uncharacterized protein n=1 Tax=Citrus sinensis TaxID=2711 RepID=A0ACB8JVE9_CITSI|nr:hypothetical protein KPL71_018200 [Citrus sinensis]